MSITEQISAYISSQSPSKTQDMQFLHEAILKLIPSCDLWFLDGKNEDGKIVSNPNIGYGSLTMHYADCSSRPFYQIGMSANTSGISIYIMGLKDKSFLKEKFGDRIGKASITGYCIKFKALKDIDFDTLLEAIQYGFNLN